MIDVKRIIKEKSIKILFQVILSPTETESVSVESFVRGVHPETGEVISPFLLFKAAKEQNLSSEFEKLCIETTFKRFSHIQSVNSQAMLYINIEKNFFTEALQTDFLYQAVIKSGLKCNQIAIDISHLFISQDHCDTDGHFITYLREKGFYISIDDIGRNYYNLDRILYYNPDIIKINHQLMSKLDTGDYKNLMMKTVSEICHRMGILVVSTGVESVEDIVKSMESGSQLIQGFYVSSLEEYDYEEIEEIINTFDRSIIFEYVEAQYKGTEREAITGIISFINTLRMRIDDQDFSQIDSIARRLMENYPFIESGYLLDHNGIQISKSYINKKTFHSRNKELFGLYKKGNSHVNREYYTRLQNSILTDWVTHPYRSKLTNEVCITASFKIEIPTKEIMVVVLNIDYNKFEHFEDS